MKRGVNLSSTIGKHCPYCQQPITKQEEIILCKQCQTLHHHRCWVEHQGCAVVGCEGAFGDGEVYYEPPAPESSENNSFTTDGQDKHLIGRNDDREQGRKNEVGADSRSPLLQTFIDGFNFAFRCFERQAAFLILLPLGIIAVCVIAGLLMFLLMAISPFVAVLYNLAWVAASIFISIGILKIYLKIADGQKAEIDDLFSGGEYFLPTIGAGLLVTLGVIIGSFLLVIPGLVFAFLNVFTPLLIVDRSMGAIEAIQTSIRLVIDNLLLALVLSLVMGVLNFIGSLFFGIGVLLTGPISTFLLIYCYRQVLGHD